ncbi:MAG: hypothetical protein WC881_12245, partial [Elusimicrobiota bacterium]
MRRQLWTWAALLAASLIILCAVPGQYLGRQQDDLLYIISSHALASGSYRLFTSPGQPPITMIMPGFPILLLPVTWLAGNWYGLYQAFCALILAGLPWLIWRWLRRGPRLEPAGNAIPALLIALLFATNPMVLTQAGTVMSEGAYTALALLLLTAIENNRAPAAGGLLLALTQLRPAGLSLIPAALYRPWRDGDRRSALWTALPAALGLLAWWAWSLYASGYVDEAREIHFSYAGHPWLQPWYVAADNARYYLRSWAGSYLPPRWNAAAGPLGLLLLPVAIRGLWRLWRQEPARPAILMLAGAGLMHAFWAWQYERYLIPLLPWLLWALAAGAGTKARWLLSALLCLQLSSHHRLWTSRPAAAPELSRTYAWIASHTQPSDIIASPMYVRDGFLCGRPSLALPDTPDPAEFAQALRRRQARFVIWQDGLDIGLSADRTATLRLRLDRIRGQLQDSGGFRLVQQEASEGARIYEL